MQIGLIGFGTIGRAVARAIQDGRVRNIELRSVLVRDVAKLNTADIEKLGAKITSDPDEFFAAEAEVIIEAAGHAALKQYAVRTLLTGRDMLAVSVGAFSDDEFLTAVKAAAEESGHRLLVPSGALGALDAISSGAVGNIAEVTLIARKPPAAWKGTPAEEAASRATTEPICFYEGPAREATRLYPQNVNVAAALSLAGIGLDRTKIRMFADPTITLNTFEIVAHGDFGELKLVLGNKPYPENPKTGHLVVMSVIKSLRRLQEKLIVGF